MLQETRLESGVDYLTAVTLYEKSTSVMLNKAGLIAKDEEKLGNEVSPWGMAGFEGFKVGQVQLGSRGNEGIVRLSGERAADDWYQIYELCDKLTRVDVQETYRLSLEVTPFILKQYKAVRSWSKDHQKNLSVSVWHNSAGGCTLYIGSRQSEVMVRIYNKAVESGDDYYAGCVRYEAELKGKRANHAAFQLSSGRLVQSVIYSLLSAFSSKYHCYYPSLPEYFYLAPPRTSPKSSDASRACEWLSNNVRPTVRKVINLAGPCEARKALGLTTEDLIDMLECDDGPCGPERRMVM